MAVTQASLTGGSDDVNRTAYTTASITPSANRLVLAAILNRQGGGATTPTLSGNGLTWVQIATIEFGTIASPNSRLTLFRTMGASPSAGAVTIDFGGVTQSSCCWSITEFNGVDTGGTHGSAAVVQNATNRADSASSLTVTLATFGSASNATYGCFGAGDVQGTFTPGTGFTEIHDVNTQFGPTTLETEWRNDSDTSVDATSSATGDLGGIAVEIKAASSDITIAAGVGTLTLSGQAVSIEVDLSVAAGVGTLTLSGQAVTIDESPPLTVAAGVGVLTLSGQAVSIAVDLSVAAGIGVLVLGGQAVTVEASSPITITVGKATLNFSGLDVTIDDNATPFISPHPRIPLALQIFDSPGGTLLADWSDNAQFIEISTNEHGFESLRFFVEMSMEDAFYFYDMAPAKYISLNYGAGVVWDGRVEDRRIITGGLELGALGHWRAMSDAPYTALWSDASTAGWRQINQNDYANAHPQRYEMDNNNRLYIAIRKDEQSDDLHQGAYGYITPDQGNRQIVAISFDWELVGDSGYTASLARRNSGWVYQSAPWTATTDGTTQTGTEGLTFTACDALTFRLYKTGATPTTFTGETGDTAIKITNIRIKTTTDSEVHADAIVIDLVDFISTLNSEQLSDSIALIEDPDLDLQDEIYEDSLPADILTKLSGLGDDQTPPRRWEVGVWENQELHFRPRGSASRDWYVDAVELEVDSTLDTLINSVYAVYQDANTRSLRTDANDDTDSQAKYGITRRGPLQVSTTSQSQAETHRDAFLDDKKDITVRSTIKLTGLFDQHGAQYPLWMARSGDSVTIRNLPPTLSVEIDKIRTFRLSATRYNLTDDLLSLTPEQEIPSLEFLVARREEGFS